MPLEFMEGEMLDLLFLALGLAMFALFAWALRAIERM